MRSEIDDLVVACMARADGVWAKAEAEAITALETDRDLFDRIAWSLIRQAVRVRVRDAAHKVRRSCLSGMTTSPRPELVAGKRAVADDLRHTLYDFPLVGGVRLGDANRPQVREAREHYEINARENMWRERWLRAVEGRLKDDVKIVQDVVSLSALTKLQKEARRAA